MTPDRRRFPRIAYRGGVLPPTALVLPGRPVVIVSLSASGLLLETEWRIRPGRLVEVRLQFSAVTLIARADVLRAWVSALDKNIGIRYRAALAFTAPIAVPPPVDHIEAYRSVEAVAAVERRLGEAAHQRRSPEAVGRPRVVRSRA